MLVKVGGWVAVEAVICDPSAPSTTAFGTPIKFLATPEDGLIDVLWNVILCQRIVTASWPFFQLFKLILQAVNLFSQLVDS